MAQNIQNVKNIKKITLAGLIVNLFLSAFKIIFGVLGHSQAVIADGIHSISDCVTDLVLIIGVDYWAKPPDECHPYGHNKIETIVTSIIGFILVGAGLGIIYKAISNIHDGHSQTPTPIALIAAVSSIIVKEILFRWTYKKGKQEKSMALIANAWHHRVDGFSSIPVTIAVLGAILYPDFKFLDLIGAFFVSIFILQGAYKILKPAVLQLMEHGAPKESIKIIQSLSEQVPGVISVDRIRGRMLGSFLHVDLIVVVEHSLTVYEGHEIATAVKTKLKKDGPDVIDVVIHMEPSEKS
jgi:cation diffusion facilitator family transporter